MISHFVPPKANLPLHWPMTDSAHLFTPQQVIQTPYETTYASKLLHYAGAAAVSCAIIWFGERSPAHTVLDLELATDQYLCITKNSWAVGNLTSKSKPIATDSDRAPLPILHGMYPSFPCMHRWAAATYHNLQEKKS
jgi:hypothetical protein